MFKLVNPAGFVVEHRQSVTFMKRITFTLVLALAFLTTLFAPRLGQAARPNPPTIAGTVPVVLIVSEPGGTNLVAVPPRVLVIDERGKNVADVETTVVGLTGSFHIPLKKAGTYVVVGYYPEPNRLTTVPLVVDVLRKSTATVSLNWQPQ